jgi:hypothetical protein
MNMANEKTIIMTSKPNEFGEPPTAALLIPAPVPPTPPAPAPQPQQPVSPPTQKTTR